MERRAESHRCAAACRTARGAGALRHPDDLQCDRSRGPGAPPDRLHHQAAVCPFPGLPPMVGYARTVTIRSVLKSSLPPDEQARRRIAYYEYMGTGLGPRITVIQDIDGPDVGYGAFWGEVQSNVHKALGCLGVITDGSIRDI